ncbi:hypothetical protein [Streptomyces sp. NPDC055085]
MTDHATLLTYAYRYRGGTRAEIEACCAQIMDALIDVTSVNPGITDGGVALDMGHRTVKTEALIHSNVALDIGRRIVKHAVRDAAAKHPMTTLVGSPVEHTEIVTPVPSRDGRD